MTLIVIYSSDLTVTILRMSEAVTSLTALMKVGTIAFHVMLVFQSCTDPLQVLPGASCGTFPSSSDGTYDVGNIKFEKDIEIKEEEKVDVKVEKGIYSDEEECIDIKDEKGIHNEEKEEDMDIEEEDVDIKEEVSCEDTV
jgi:hypothetical protein